VLFIEALVVPALVVLLLVLLAFGSSWVGPVRQLGSAGKFVVLGALLVAGALAMVLRPGRSSRARPRTFGAVLVWLSVLFVIVCAASATWSSDPTHSAHFTVAILLLMGGALVVPWQIARRPGGRRMLANAVLLALVLIVVGDAAAFVVDHSGSLIREVGMTQRFRGFLESPNTIAAYAFAVPLGVWRTLEFRSIRARLAAAALVAVYLGELLASGTRLALVMVVLTLGLFALAALGGRRSALAAAVAVLSIAAVTTFLAITQGTTDSNLPRYLRPSSVPTLGGRTEAWAAAGKLIAARPLTGYGIGEEEATLDLYKVEQARASAVCHTLESPEFCGSAPLRRERLADFSGQYVHNSFFGLAIQVGAIVASLWGLALLLAVGAAALSVRRADRLQPAVAAGLVGGLIWAFYSTYLWSPGNVVASVFWILLAIALARDPARRRA
jgi:O-antigen ligase